MPCIPIPKTPQPPFPFPYTVPPLSFPPIPTEPDLCCQLPDFIAMIAEHVPPIPLPPGTINPATAQEIAAAIQLAVDTIDSYLDQLQPECPRQE